MSRILNVASLAAVVLTATAMLALSEPGQASDLAAASVAPVVLSQSTAPVEPETQEQAPAGNQSETEIEPAPAPAPEPVRANSLADLVAATPMPEVIDEELRCLAGAVYFESRSESLAGQLAVAHVVINRTESGRFPRTMCGVVYQKSQFSFVRGGQMPPINAAHRQWRNAVAIAQIARDGGWDNAAPGALFFHARHVSPGWNRPRIAQIDNHIFYR